MTTIKLLGNRVAIEKNKKADTKKAHGGIIVLPESEEFTGTVRYVGEAAAKTIQVGQKVYFSTNYQNVRMGGTELCVMEDSQVFAIVE